MKKSNLWVAWLLVAGSLASCQSNKYEIRGTAPEALNGTYIKMLRHGNFRGGEKNSLADSTLVENGKFVLTGEITGDSVYFFTGNKGAVEFVVEPGTVTLDLVNIKNLGGTPLNDAYLKYQEEKEAIHRPFMENYNQIMHDTSLLVEERTGKIRPFVKQYTEDLCHLSASYITTYKETMMAEIILNDALNQAGSDVELFDKMYGLLGRDNISYGPLKGHVVSFNAIRATSPGQPFKDFTIANGNLDGTAASLSDYVGKGKYVLVDFWASWCGWCRAEFSTIAKVYEKHKGDNFEIVGIVVNDKLENTQKALSKEPLVTWPQIVNVKKDVMNLYGVSGIPQIILFAPDGTILARDLRGEDLIETVDEFLSK